MGIDTVQLERESFDKHLHINLHGLLYGIKHGASHMRAGGSIVNVTSLASLIGILGFAAYVAAKFGVLGLPRSVAIDLGPRGIAVNCLCLGTIDTPITRPRGPTPNASS